MTIQQAIRQNGHVADAPLVSVGMPVFNGEPYLRVAIESVLNQTVRTSS